MLHFKRKINLSGKIIQDQSPTYIIAEAGVNHGGDLSVAFKLVDVAAAAGADAVKFQAFRTEKLILNSVEKAPYQKNTTEATESQFQMLKKLELQKENYVALMNYCEKMKIAFLITPFDEQSLSELEEIGVKGYKIASTDTTNLLFLRKVAKTGKPLILSTGMCNLEEVNAALEEIHPHNDQVILLQCTANYPIRNDEANLNVIHTFKSHFDMLIGYSDHSVGIGAAPYAVPMGAKVLEKHFTLDKGAKGPDHMASLDPDELKQFVQEVRRIEQYMGQFEKEPTASEKLTKKSLQKNLVAARDIEKGAEIQEDDIVAKRTGGVGISPIRYKDVVGSRAKKSFKMDEVIYV